VSADTPVALASPARTIDGILCAASVSDATWGHRTAMNLPAMHTPVGAMAQALGAVAGPAATDLLDWDYDPVTAKLVNSWPGNVDAARARAMGLQADESFEAVVRQYIAENRQAVTLAV
jgi:hypothetical protein